jgi:hypothetical protein
MRVQAAETRVPALHPGGQQKRILPPGKVEMRAGGRWPTRIICGIVVHFSAITVTQFSQVVARFSPKTPGAIPWVVRMEFLRDKVAFGEDFLSISVAPPSFHVAGV